MLHSDWFNGAAVSGAGLSLILNAFSLFPGKLLSLEEYLDAFDAAGECIASKTGPDFYHTMVTGKNTVTLPLSLWS